MDKSLSDGWTPNTLFFCLGFFKLKSRSYSSRNHIKENIAATIEINYAALLVEQGSI